MRTRFFIVSVFIILIFILTTRVIISESSSITDYSPPLLVDKDVYEVEETVVININLDPSKYAFYELLISASNNSYTYKGDFNPIMFFYPTEEGIYTIALVEKSTRAIYYSLSFKVIPKEGREIRREDAFKPSGSEEPPKKISEEVPVSKENEEMVVGWVNTDKKEYFLGENVRVFVEVNDESRVQLYHVFNGVSEKYMGDLNYINFRPRGIGTHRLMLLDDDNNMVSTYDFKVKPVFIGKNLKISVINSKGFEEDVELRVLEEKEGSASIEIIPAKKRWVLKKMILRNIRLDDINNSAWKLSIGVDEVPGSRISILKKRVVKAFSIDSSMLNFSKGVVSGIAVGNELWKCKAWDFNNQICLGRWVKIMDLVPGQEYNISIMPGDPGYAETGVASINTKKPLYHPNETVEIIIVVLDTEGHLVRDADIILNITNPQNQTSILTTRGKSIIETQGGVYEAKYNKTSLEGNYSLLVKARGEDVNSSMLSYFVIRSYYEFDILRTTPVTTDPWRGVFESSIRIISYTNSATFNFTEVLPSNFTITNSGGAVMREQQGRVYLTWPNLRNNSVISYSARPPFISPYLYNLGPSFINYTSEGVLKVFFEARPWYLAVDPSAYYDPDTNIQQGWDDGTGTGYTEVDDGIRQPAGGNITDDYISARANDNTYAEFGFPNITQDPMNITLWIYAGSSNCGFLAYLQQGGVTRCNIDVNPGTSDNWFSCSWTPSGTYENMTVEFYQDSKDTGVPGYCYVYGVYLEVEYNNPPNVTSLLHPSDGANLSSGINIDFNFTVTDQESPIHSCTLWGNFSGVWSANKTIYNVANNTETNITINVPDGSYVWNINCSDSAGASDFYSSNYSFRVDTTPPSISYSSGAELNNTYVNRKWVYVNVTAYDINEKNITFRLYNTTGSVSSVTYTNKTHETNFTSLDSNMEYWYNVTICDEFGWCNSTETRKITLDSTHPTISYSTGTENNNTYFNRNWIYINTTAYDQNEANTTFNLYNTTGLVNTTTRGPGNRSINFTNLNPNTQYWYNVTITDMVGFKNSTETRKITLDSMSPNITLEAPANDTFVNYELVQFNYTPRDTYLDTCVLYGNFTGVFSPNETENNPVNEGINTFGPLNLSDGRYLWNVWCNDSAGNSNFSQYNYTIKVDTEEPVISNWSTNGTSFLINQYICLNVTVTDTFSGVETVLAEIKNPNLNVENVTLLDDGNGCDAVKGDNVYSASYYLEFSGNYTWLNTHAKDYANNWQTNNTNLKWDVSSSGSITVVMIYPSVNLEINESEYNYRYQQICNVSCDAGGVNCENVTLFAQYNPNVFININTTTIDLINDEDSFSCGNLAAGGAPCTHTFNITSGSNSGNNTWLIRCSASSNNVGSFVSSSVNLTINDHPYPNFTYPSNNSWLNGVEMINASASFDSDGTITNYLFEYDNNTGFDSPSTICNGPDKNCTWNTSQQDQCENNTLSCYLRVTVTDDDGLSNSTYMVVGFDTQAPIVILDLPRNFENISSDLFRVNASPTDNESGVDTVTFEYRQNSTDTWHFACNDNRGPVYDCDWNLTNLPDGNTYELRAYANDTKGNIGNPDVHTNITLDRKGPIINLESPANGTNLTYSVVTFYYNASDAISGLNNCSLIINGSVVNITDTPVEDTSLNLSYNLSDGSYNWSINCTDTLGNENTSEVRRVRIDTQGPISILDRPPSSSIITGSAVIVNASISDSGFAQVDTAIFEYRINSSSAWTLICMDNRAPVYDCTWDTTSLPDGSEYEVRVYANDSLGNTGPADTHTNIIIDNNAPDITLVFPPDSYVDTDGDLVFVYQVEDISPIKNCSLIINNEVNQTNSNVQKGEDQYFYLYGVGDNVQLDWSIQCTDYINLTSTSETRTVTVSLNDNMNLSLEMNKVTYYAGETAIITNNVTDTAGNPISDVNINTAIIQGQVTIPWWNSSWKRRKPITLSSSENVQNAIVEVNITGLNSYISSCENEIRIIRFDKNNELYSVNRSVVGGDDSDYCVVWFRANITAGVNNTEFMAYYNNSGASSPNNDVTRANQSATKTSIGGSILGSEYDVTDGTSSDTTSNNGVYYAVGRDNSPPSGQPLNAYINLSFNLSDIGVSESSFVSFNFTINYCHSDDVTPPITCGNAIGAGTPGTAYVQLYDFDSSSWATGFDTITQDVNSSAENTESYVETSNLGSYIDDTTQVVGVRFETDIGSLGKSDDASFALDYATLKVLYKEQVLTGLGSVGNPDILIAANSSVTDYEGLWVWNWDTSGVQEGNYSAVSLAQKSGYNNAYNYSWFEIKIDNTGPVSVLDRPHNDSVIDALSDGYYYMVNASVSDSGVGNISTVTFMYRYNSSDTWKLICTDNDGAAPYNCTWDLTSLSNGYDYEVRVYANDSLGNIGESDTHINITIITQPVNITSIVVDDSFLIPVDEIDLKAGTTRLVRCNITVQDPEVYTNIGGVNATFYSSTTSYGAADNNRTHYTNKSCSFLSGGGESADYICAFNVWYYAINGSWNCTAVTWNNYSTDNATDNTTINQLFALNISTSVIDYTTLQPNQTSPNINVNISNVGNMPMNISVYGFGGEEEATGTGLSMVCEINNISVSFERYSTSSAADYASKKQLSSSPQDVGLTIPPKTSPNEVRVNSTYWQFMVPPESHTLGQCNGSVVFVASMP